MPREFSTKLFLLNKSLKNRNDDPRMTRGNECFNPAQLGQTLPKGLSKIKNKKTEETLES